MMFYKKLDTPLGEMIAVAGDDGIRMLEFSDKADLAAEMDSIKKEPGESLLMGDHPALDQLTLELKSYFKGELQTFKVPLAPMGTDFQKQVWSALLTIPYGETCSYGVIATKIQNPKSVRAVGSANGKNHIAIIIPCHRVIGANGKLTGYAGGLWRKQWLLEHENYLMRL